MKLREILNLVDTMIENSISPEIKVKWIDIIQNELFRDYPVPDAVYPFVTDGQFYIMPEDCSEDRIQRLVVDGRTYEYVPVSVNTLLPRFWTVVSEEIMIQPEPSKGLKGFLYYRPRPIELTIDNLDAIPTFPSDFIELLILGCAVRVAKAINSEKAQTYQYDFNALAEKARRTLTKPKQRTVNKTRRWR